MIGPAKIYFIIFGLLTIVGRRDRLRLERQHGFDRGGLGLRRPAAARRVPFDEQLHGRLGDYRRSFRSCSPGDFIPAFLKTNDFMPAGMMSILSVIGIVMAILAFMKR